MAERTRRGDGIAIDYQKDVVEWWERREKKKQEMRERAAGAGMDEDDIDWTLHRVRESRERLDAYLTPKGGLDRDGKVAGREWLDNERANWLPPVVRQSKSLMVLDENAAGDVLQRVQVARPMTFSGMAEEVVSFHPMGKVTRDTYRRTLTALDKAFSGAERSAVERFLFASVLALGAVRIADYSGMPQGGSDPGSRMPFTDRERVEIGARQFVFLRLTPAFQREADLFVRLMFGDDTRFEGDEQIINLLDLGKEYTGSTDERVQRGAAIALARKLGQQIYYHYMEWEHEVRKTRLSRKSQHA